MTTSVAIRHDDHVTDRHSSKLVPVLVKRLRVFETSVNEKSMLNFHTFKCFGGVLNPHAQHGRGFYVRRVVGQSKQVVMRQLQDIAQQRQESI